MVNAKHHFLGIQNDISSRKNFWRTGIHSLLSSNLFSHFSLLFMLPSFVLYLFSHSSSHSLKRTSILLHGCHRVCCAMASPSSVFGLTNLMLLHIFFLFILFLLFEVIYFFSLSHNTHFFYFVASLSILFVTFNTPISSWYLAFFYFIYCLFFIISHLTSIGMIKWAKRWKMPRRVRKWN